MELSTALAAQVTAGVLFAAVLLMTLIPMWIVKKGKELQDLKRGKVLSFRQYRRYHK
jgi:hypothetical protein